MRTAKIGVLFALALALGTSGCDDKKGKDKDKKEDDKKAEKGDDGKAADEEGGDEGEKSLKVAEGDPPVDGPLPPQESMVFFAMEGGLLPLACFDKAKKKLLAGNACLGLVNTGDQARLSSGDAEYNKKVGDRIEAQCTAGSGKKNALGVEAVGEVNYKFATFPAQALKLVTYVPEDTTDPQNAQVDDDTKAKLVAAVKKHFPDPKTELTMHQFAKIDVDGDANKEHVYALYYPHPNIAEQFSWSGVFLAPGGDLDKLVLLDKARNKPDVFEVRGTLDLDGDKKKELWLRNTFTEGGGDRVVVFDGTSAKPLAKYTCGA